MYLINDPDFSMNITEEVDRCTIEISCNIDGNDIEILYVGDSLDEGSIDRALGLAD